MDHRSQLFRFDAINCIDMCCFVWLCIHVELEIHYTETHVDAS